MRITFVLAPSLAIGAACAHPAAPRLTPQVQAGPGYGSKPTRVLALSASCGSVEFRCPREYVDTVDNIVRGGMEFAGYALVQPDNLRMQDRQRHEEHESDSTATTTASHTKVERALDFDDNVTASSSSATVHQQSTVVLDGPGFDDLTVGERNVVVADAGADSVLTTRIVVGALQAGWVPDQDVEVQVKLGVGGGDTMAWAARCTASSNDFSTVDAALEHAARCAISAATAR